MKQKKRADLSHAKYYYQGAVKESFLHLEAAERRDAAGLTEKDNLSRWKIRLRLQE